MNDYLTLDDLAQRWGVKLQTLYVRRHRGNLPEPDIDKANKPLWLVSTIEEYEKATGGEMGPFVPTDRRRSDQGRFEREIHEAND